MREPSPYFIQRRSAPEPALEAEFASSFFEDETTKIDLWVYWRLIRKHLRLIGAIVAGTVFVTLLHLLMTTPIYTAETTLMILPKAPTGIDPAEAMIEIEAAYDGSDYFKTQSEILKSRTLAAAVVRNLGLNRNPAFTGSGRAGLFSTVVGQLRQRLHDLVTPPPPGSTSAPRSGLLGVSADEIDGYLGGLNIRPIPSTSLVEIDYSSPDPMLAARIANAHAEAYIDRGIEMHSQASKDAERFLSQKLVELKDQLEKSEVALNDYRRAKGIIPGLMSLDGKDAVVIDRLTDLSKDLTRAQVERIGLESQVELIHRHLYESLPVVMDDKQVQTMQAELNQLAAQDASLSNQFTAAYPPLAQLRAKEGALKDRLHQEIQNSINGVESSYQQALEKEHELDAEMQRQRTMTMSLNDAAVQYAILQRDVDTYRQLYNAVLKRMKNVGVEAEAQTSNVSIVDKATAPRIPSYPKKVRALMVSAVLGLLGALGLAFLLDYLDNTLKDPEEAERYLRLPNIGIIPEFNRLNSAGYGPKGYAPAKALTAVLATDGGGDTPKALTNGSNGNGANGARSRKAAAAVQELVTEHGSYSALGEAYRNLRTALLLSRAGAPPKVTLVTSAIAGEGKTVTAVNTAAMLAQLGASVLLIDADMRRPRCHRVLDLDNNLGLTEVLTGVRDLHDLIRPTAVPNLFFLGSGSVPPNATELVGSSKMHQVVTQLQQIYDYIVIDSPPVMPVSDALLLSTIVDGVLLVTNASRTAKQQVRAARARLEYARAKIFGTVLNRVRMHHSEYQYYNHQSYYSPGDEDAALHQDQEAP
ncbi:MAG TPA: polysaccharide biosynthesis tyrosine autokinase [Candidatus Binataceae bacterium]|nr:polysaccharide biosynthesis tyrosine autokinase [Candidatus Binataceae bacterium]